MTAMQQSIYITTAAQADSSLYFPGNGRARHENNQYAPCRYPVALPSKDQGWNWGFHSCNGLSISADVRKWKDPHVWEDVLQASLKCKRLVLLFLHAAMDAHRFM